MLRKPRSYAEIYNDLDGEVVNVFRCARDHGAELREMLRLTPFAREEFDESYLPSESPMERARHQIVRSFMGFGSNSSSCGHKSGFRANSNRSGTTPAHDWINYAEAFETLIDRMRGIVIENRDAREVMFAHDGPETLHYVDPPYVHSTRADSSKHSYRHEMSDEDHEALAGFLIGLKGNVIISGYESTLYDRMYAGWNVLKKSALADGARERTECLWLSPGMETGRLI